MIKTWLERLADTSDEAIITNQSIKFAMQDEIDELREKLAALTRINSDLCRVHNERLIDTARLATDAARYREIRKGHALTVKMKKTVGIYAAQTDKDYPEALDAAIDAAMEST